MGWSALRVGCKENHAKSASARVLRGRSAGSQQGALRAGRAARNSEALNTLPRSRSRRPGPVSVMKGLSQRRAMKRTLRWQRRKPRQVRQRARAPWRWLQRQPGQVRQRVRASWAVGRFPTGRNARGLHGTQPGSFGYVVSKPQPPIWRGCVEVEPRLTAWDGARSLAPCWLQRQPH